MSPAASVAYLIRMSHPLWTLYVGRQEDGDPVEVSRETVEIILTALDRMVEQDGE